MTRPLHLSTRADQIAHYKAVRQRIHQAAYKKPVLAIVPAVKSSHQWTRRPMWRREDIHFDDHVIRWKIRQIYTPTDWLRDKCREYGVSVHHIIGPQRRRAIAKIRFQLIWEMNEAFQLTLPQLGRIFGGRDHTTMINSLKRWEAMRHENDC